MVKYPAELVVTFVSECQVVKPHISFYSGKLCSGKPGKVSGGITGKVFPGTLVNFLAEQVVNFPAERW